MLTAVVKGVEGLKGCRVTVEAVSKTFGAFRALESVNLDIKKGEFFSLLGPSGCGKTTLLRLIAGFDDPTSGDIRLDGSSVLPLPSNRRQVNTVFQNYALFPHLSVFDNIAFPLRLRKMDKKQIAAKVEEYLVLVRLEAHRTKLPSQLSGGQKQRVAIARALINEPGVLLLDEPLAALDAKLRQHMLIELDAIHDAIGITFIYVTHDQQEAIGISDRVAVMNEGSVLQIGTPLEIYENPANTFVARFIGETNLLEGTVTGANDTRAEINTPGLGTILAERDKPVKVGDRVEVAVRPEKILVGREKPANLGPDVTCLRGTVDEIIYTGFLSKYFVQIGKVTLRVFRQHANHHLTRESVITFGDSVFLWWHAADAFIVEARAE